MPVLADSRIPPSAHAAAAPPLELIGSPASLAYPDVCASCGTPARTRLTIDKVFERNDTDNSPRRYVIGTAGVPFCPTCVAKHEREVRRIGGFWRMLLCFRSGVMIGAIGPALIGGLMLQAALQRAVHGDTRAVEILGGLAALFALISLACVWAAYKQTRRFAIPAPTSVTRAFDFSDDRARRFEPPRHLYRLSNPAFAEAFRALNRDRHWDPASPRAIRASRARWIVGALVILAAILLALREPIRHLLGW